MNPEQWREIKRIFEEAQELATYAQADFVHVSSGGDADLEIQVLRLLQANASTGGFLGKPIADLHRYIAARADEPVLEMATVYPSRFKVLQFLSRGGMGEVYEAWDAELR